MKKALTLLVIGLMSAFFFVVPAIAQSNQTIYYQNDFSTQLLVINTQYAAFTITQDTVLQGVSFYCALDPYTGAGHQCIFELERFDGTSTTTPYGFTIDPSPGLPPQQFSTTTANTLLLPGIYTTVFTNNVGGDSTYTQGSASGVPYLLLTGSGGQAIDWTAIQEQPLFATNSPAIASSSALWGSLTIASSSVQCASGDFIQQDACAVISYLFIPNPNIFNTFLNTAAVYQNKFPFSWMFGLQTSIDTLQASSTENMVDMNMSLSQANFASTTAFGSFLPDVNTFSSSTVLKYFPTPLWNLGQELIAAALWFALIFMIFSTTRSRFHRL